MLIETATRDTTLADDAYEALRWDIVSGALPAGGPLRMEALRARYGLGFSPLREALNRLEGERLVTLVPQRGFAVAPLSLAAMWDALEARILIESQALRLAVARGGDDWESAIVASFHALATSAARIRDTAPDAGALRALEERHQRFHRALIAACGSPWLLRFAETLYAATERFRFPALGGLMKGSARDVTAEHRAILEAALARDPDSLVGLVAQHYRRTGESLARVYADGADVPPP